MVRRSVADLPLVDDVHRILQVMREGLATGRTGNLALVRLMTGELAIWFLQHAQTMDAALALHLRRAGFDPGRFTSELSLKRLCP